MSISLFSMSETDTFLRKNWWPSHQLGKLRMSEPQAELSGPLQPVAWSGRLLLLRGASPIVRQVCAAPLMGQDVTCNLNLMSSGCSFVFFHRFAHHEHSEQLLSEEGITGKFYHVNIYLIPQNISSSHTTSCLELQFIYSLLLSGCTWLRNLPKIKVQKCNGCCSRASAFSCSLLLWQVVLYACFASRC